MENNDTKKAITRETVEYAARLSRLKLDEKDIGIFQGQLENILEYVAQLKEVDTKDTLPTTHVLSSMKNVFREDTVKKSLSPDAALQSAPSKERDFFKVPKIIDT